jgi:hypothetical protein
MPEGFTIAEEGVETHSRALFALIGLVAGAVAVDTAACGAPILYRPGREYRTVNTDVYEIKVQKNGRTDVVLPSLEAPFDNAYPMVWIEGEKEPRPLPVDGRLTARENVNNRLGQGHGIFFQKGECEWLLQAYPTTPYLSAQVAFVNTTKKPVRVKMLVPWAVGQPRTGGFSLGPDMEDLVVLENGRRMTSNGDMPQRVTGEATSLWNLAAYHPGTQRSLIAGFLTNVHGWTQLRIERGGKPDKDGASLFRAECIYDPPVELAPGERFESEILYLSVGEKDPLEGLERFGAVSAAFNGVQRRRRFLPHGWDSWNTKYKTEINEERLLAALDFVDKRLKRYGWTHFAIDSGWERGRGNWEPDPAKFPHGMKWFADQIHGRGMTAGIWIDPFTVQLDAPVAQAHPEWLTEPNADGRELIGQDARILDVTAPGAYEYVRDLCAKLGNTWGYDGLQEADFVYHLLCAESYFDKKMTRIEVMRMGMTAIQEGFGADKLITTFTPLPVTGLFANVMRIGDDCAPIWRKAPDKWPWGAVDAMTNAARRYYFAPHLWATDPDCVYFERPETRRRWEVTDRPELTWNQSIAWLTAAALTGGVVKIGDWFPDLNDKEVAALSRVLPTPVHPARPVDLFERETPCIWSLPIKATIGEWNIVAVFNWDESARQTILLGFSRLGMDPGAYYTVYDFWRDTYHGLARGQLTVDAPPGSVHLLGLRRYEDHPMFLATDRHFTQGATDFKTLEWDPQTKRLSGTFEGVADTDYNLRILTPEPYTFQSMTVSAGEARTERDGPVLKVGFHCAEQGSVAWTAQF